jgi:hypothetical protein
MPATVLELFKAIEDCDPAGVERCLGDIGERVNGMSSDDVETDEMERFQGLSPLMLAIALKTEEKADSKRIVHLIIAHPLTKIKWQSSKQATAIYFAALQGDIELMIILLAKAKSEAEREGLDPARVIKALVNLPALVPEDEDDKDSVLILNTPINAAIDAGEITVVQALLEAGAELRNDKSKTHPLVNAIGWRNCAMQFVHSISPGRFPADDYIIEPLDELIAVLRPVLSGDLSEQLREYEQGLEKHAAIIELLRKKMSPETVLTVAGAMADIVLFRKVLEENPGVNLRKAKEAIESCLRCLDDRQELRRGFYKRMLDLIKVQAEVTAARAGAFTGPEAKVGGVGLAAYSVFTPAITRMTAEEAAGKTSLTAGI